MAWSRCTITDGLFRRRLDSGKGITEYFPCLGSGEEEVFDRGDGLSLFLFLYSLLFLDPDV